MNLFACTGHLGRDAEMKTTPTGTPILSFSVAVNSGYGDRKETIWLKCAMFGNRGEKLVSMLRKGKQIAVHGELRLRPWIDNGGAARPGAEIVVSDLSFIGGKSQEHASTPALASKQTAPDFDDDIPF